MRRAKILVVEDCDSLRAALNDSLRDFYEVDTAPDGEAAFAILKSTPYDLVILDVGLPKMDGYKFCTMLKAHEATASIPVIFLSGNIAVEDKLVGFSVGGSDYMTKPCDLRELLARIKAQLELQTKAKSAAQNFEVGSFRGNLSEQRISYINGTERVVLDLTPIEFKLLYFLLTHVDHVLSRDHLLDRVWGEARHIGDRTVDVVVSKLRQKLGPFGHCLKSVRGEGYKFLPPDVPKKTG